MEDNISSNLVGPETGAENPEEQKLDLIQNLWR